MDELTSMPETHANGEYSPGGNKVELLNWNTTILNKQLKCEFCMVISECSD